MQTEELRLDGNAAGGTLRYVFAHEMTVALAVRYPYRVSPYVNDYAKVLTPQTITALQNMLGEMHSRKICRVMDMAATWAERLGAKNP